MQRREIGTQPGNPVDARRLEASSEAEPGLLEGLYRQEIEHTLAELSALTQGFQGEVDSRMATYIRDTLNVLSACYGSSALTTQALDVLAQHLRTLLQALKQDYANTFS